MRWPPAAKLTDAKTLIGLLWLQNWRAGRVAVGTGSQRRSAAGPMMTAR